MCTSHLPTDRYIKLAVFVLFADAPPSLLSSLCNLPSLEVLVWRFTTFLLRTVKLSSMMLNTLHTEFQLHWIFKPPVNTVKFVLSSRIFTWLYFGATYGFKWFVPEAGYKWQDASVCWLFISSPPKCHSFWAPVNISWGDSVLVCCCIGISHMCSHTTARHGNAIQPTNTCASQCD